MKFLKLWLAYFTSSALSSLLPSAVERRAAPDPACTNGPDSRACWSNGYSIATDFDQKFPVTGNTRYYNWVLTNGTCNPDGHGSRLCLLINGQYPGPLLRATWGDTVQVTVKNSMQNNGTGIHFHGVRQYHSSGDDGVNGVTECPLAPGDTKTYTFMVTQFGTSWYHSHFSSQYGDGIVGPIIFDGPASANYDVDLGTYMLSDWYYQTAFQINAIASQNLQKNAGPPNADNILINGTNKNANGGGSYNQVTVRKGKKYRLRLINSSVDNYFFVSLDNHVMQVMTSDYIPINPYFTETLVIGIGQRYDVVINANQTAGNYWFRVDVASPCLSGNNFYGRAIWTYSGVKRAIPTSSPYTEPSSCTEPTNLSPYWVQPVPSGSFSSAVQTMDVSITKQVIVPGGDAIFVWALGNQSFNIDWANPTMSYLMQGNTSWPEAYEVIPTVSEGGWNYWVIQQDSTNPPIPHPIHLHGHDFFVLGQGSGTFSASSASLNYATPPRRDTSNVPAGGWLALAFLSNNPGVWLMHCHIAWHVSEGLAVQFLESPSTITFPPSSAYDTTCNNWKAYAQKPPYWPKDDSGV